MMEKTEVEEIAKGVKDYIEELKAYRQNLNETLTRLTNERDTINKIISSLEARVYKS